MKFEHPDWPSILKGRLKKSGLQQNELAAKLKMLPQSVHAALLRPKHKNKMIINMSLVFGEDLMVHFLADETKVVLNKAREAGVSLGEENELLAWKAEIEQKTSLIAQQQEALTKKTEELEQIKKANQDLKKLLAGLQTEYDTLANAKAKEEKAKDKEIQQLEEEKRNLEIESNLRIAVLEGKMEILLGK